MARKGRIIRPIEFIKTKCINCFVFYYGIYFGMVFNTQVLQTLYICPMSLNANNNSSKGAAKNLSRDKGKEGWKLNILYLEWIVFRIF